MKSAGLGVNLISGLTLAAIGIPEQMATAQLAGLAPEIGLIAFVAASVGFAVFGFHRVISVGADSTIAPIFAGTLVLVAASGSPQYAALAAIMAVIVGIILILCGRFGLGWIADLFSMPVTTGFLAGVALHILVLQLPILLGLPTESGAFPLRVMALARDLPKINAIAAAAGLCVFAVAFISERISPRIPGALVGLLLAAGGVAFVGATSHGVAMLAEMHLHLPQLAFPDVSFASAAQMATLALVLSIVVMLQTAATARSFGSDNSVEEISRTFVGVGAANIVAGIAGGFPVNTSPPRTAVITETGGTSQLVSLVAAALAIVLAFFGAKLVGSIPASGLAGILLFVALRIVRVQTALTVFRQTRAEFLLILATMLAILLLPMQTGIAVGIVLSLLHGMWTASRTQVVEFEHLSGTSIWWTPTNAHKGEKLDGVMVLSFPAPLSFLNAYEFKRGVLDALDTRKVALLVIEANGIAEFDFTAAQVLQSLMDECAARHVTLAFARLESERAQEALDRFHLREKLGPDCIFQTVDEAVRTLKPASAKAH